MLGCYQSVFTLAIVFALWRSTSAEENSCEAAKWTDGSFCHTVGYNTTILCDRFGYRSQDDAFQVIHQFHPLVKIGCSADAALFFCSAYLPLCIPPNIAILPCRSLCLSVKSGCESIMKKFGFKWPEPLNCSNFPVGDDNQLCISKPKNTLSTEPPASPSTVLVSSINATSASQPRSSHVSAVKRINGASSQPPTSNTMVTTTMVTSIPTKKRTLKKLQRKCKKSRKRLNRRCCQKGKKAMKMKLSTCSLEVSITKGVPRKVRKFLRRTTKLCSGNIKANECYQSCCRHQKQRQNKQ